MATQMVPREDWPEFFDEYSATHAGKPANAQLIGQGIPDMGEARHLPFEGVTYEEKGSDSHSVRVMLGDTPGDHLTHEVPSPTQVWVRPHAGSEPAMLEIHGSDGHRLILTFQG